MQIRRAAVDDLDAVVDIASIVDPPADDAEVDVSYYRHLLEHGTLVLAEESEIVIGYCAAIEVGPSWHVTDLFLHQDARGRGLGRGLLDAVWETDAALVPRQTFSSLDAAALPLYVRAGMSPLWPLLYLNGSSSALPLSRLHVEEIDPARAAAFEAQWLGWERPSEYGYWAARREARIFAVADEASTLAVGCAVANRGMYTLSRLVCGDALLVPEVVAAAARWCGDDVMVAVPGSNRAVPMLFDAGWRYVEHDLYCASEPGLVDPGRLLPHPGLL